MGESSSSYHMQPQNSGGSSQGPGECQLSDSCDTDSEYDGTRSSSMQSEELPRTDDTAKRVHGSIAALSILEIRTPQSIVTPFVHQMLGPPTPHRISQSFRAPAIPEDEPVCIHEPPTLVRSVSAWPGDGTAAFGQIYAVRSPAIVPHAHSADSFVCNDASDSSVGHLELFSQLSETLTMSPLERMSHSIENEIADIRQKQDVTRRSSCQNLYMEMSRSSSPSMRKLSD